MTIEELQAQVQVVARARQTKLEAVGKQLASLEAWQKANQELCDWDSEATKLVMAEEAKLREMTLAIFNETGDKKPLPEVGIREGSELKYDPALALAYAKEHGVALKLDVSSFEKMAKISELRPGFVEVVPVVTATIATKLEVK